MEVALPCAEFVEEPAEGVAPEPSVVPEASLAIEPEVDPVAEAEAEEP